MANGGLLCALLELWIAPSGGYQQWPHRMPTRWQTSEPLALADARSRWIPACARRWGKPARWIRARTARARWRSRSLPPGARSLARNTCPVSPPRPPPLPPLGGGARKTPRAAALLTLRGLSGVWVRVYFNQFAFFVKLYIFVHLGISPIVIPRASCKGARSLPVRASSKLRAQTNQNQLHGRGCAPNSPRVWGAAGAVPRSFVA